MPDISGPNNEMMFTIDAGSKYIFKINGRVVKVIQEPWYRRLYYYLKQRL